MVSKVVLVTKLTYAIHMGNCCALLSLGQTPLAFFVLQ